jgi:hypothetical protein
VIVIKVDVSKPVIDFDGVTVVNQQRIIQREIPTGELDEDGKPKMFVVQEAVDVLDAEGNPKPFTIRNAIAKAVQTLRADEREAGDHPAEIKAEVFKVMCRISAASSNFAELDDEDRTIIESRSTETLNALLRGRVMEALEQGEKIDPSMNGNRTITELASVE